MEWHYTDSRGVPQVGTVERTIDRGGSDVSYYFRSKANGTLTVKSGLALTPNDHANWGYKPGCPICEENR